jgi:mevalonate kinase
VPAIAVPVATRRTEVELIETDASREIAVDDARGVDTALAAQMARLALDQTETPARGARIKINSTVALGAGLGSSAALSVALVRACRGGASLPAEVVSRRANELERLAHGTPSGIDAATIAHEQPILFEKGKPPVVLRLAVPLRLAVGVLARTGTTASLVAAVRRLRDEQPAAFGAALSVVRRAIEEVHASVERGDWATLAKHMSANQATLERLGVSTPGVRRACDASVGAGALAAKLSGAGGGGAVIALLGPSSDPDRVLTALREVGAFDTFVAEVTTP